MGSIAAGCPACAFYSDYKREQIANYGLKPNISADQCFVAHQFTGREFPYIKEIMMKRKLCPRTDESMTFIGLRVPDSLFGDIEAVRRTHVQTRSEFVRTLVIEALRARGRVMTASEMAEIA